MYLGEEENGSEAVPEFLDVILQGCSAYDQRLDHASDGVMELSNEMVDIPEYMYGELGLPLPFDLVWKKLEAVTCRPWFR